MLQIQLHLLPLELQMVWRARISYVVVRLEEGAYDREDDDGED